MIRKKLVILCFCLFCLQLAGAGPRLKPAPAPAAAGEAGYALLQDVVAGFGEMAGSGKGGYKAVNALLQRCMAGLKKASAQGQVDAVFFKRYKRILQVLKLAILDTPYDKEGILDSFIRREMKKFIDDVTGIEEPLPAHRGVGVIAAAIAVEVLNLHIYLDGRKNRRKLVEKYMSWTKPSKGKK